MEILILKTKDAEQYQALRLEALQNNPESFASSYEEEKEFPLSKFKERLERPYTFGAFENGKLIGIITLLSQPGLKLKHKASIYAFYVSPEKRGLGTGKQLMKEAIQKAKEMAGVEQIQLTVTASNEAAIRLYESLGFQVFGKEKDALKIGDLYYDEVYMALFL